MNIIQTNPWVASAFPDAKCLAETCVDGVCKAVDGGKACVTQIFTSILGNLYNYAAPFPTKKGKIWTAIHLVAGCLWHASLIPAVGGFLTCANKLGKTLFGITTNDKRDPNRLGNVKAIIGLSGASLAILGCLSFSLYKRYDTAEQYADQVFGTTLAEAQDACANSLAVDYERSDIAFFASVLGTASKLFATAVEFYIPSALVFSYVKGRQLFEPVAEEKKATPLKNGVAIFAVATICGLMPTFVTKTIGTIFHAGGFTAIEANWLGKMILVTPALLVIGKNLVLSPIGMFRKNGIARAMISASFGIYALRHWKILLLEGSMVLQRIASQGWLCAGLGRLVQ